MGKYNFDEIIDRRGTNCRKWDSCEEGVIPLWIADMDFKAAPAIYKAIVKRANHPIYGYVNVPQTYYDAVIKWFSRRHGWNGIKTESIIHTVSVVPALAATLGAITKEGGKVLIQSPVYDGFYECIQYHDCIVVDNALVFENGRYEIDFKDFEAKASDPEVKAFVLCNPHNPAGRVWTEEELRKMGEICFKHNVTVISDEIYCDFAFSGKKYTPFATLGEEFESKSIFFTSASKSFNLGGLRTANIIVPNPDLKAIVERSVKHYEVSNMNPFGLEALIAAYNESEDWLEEMLSYIEANYKFLRDFFAKELPQFTVAEMEGTYLAWVKVGSKTEGEVCWENATAFCDKLLEAGKVRFNPGGMYGNDDFIRVNLACPRSVLAEALGRLKKFVG